VSDELSLVGQFTSDAAEAPPAEAMASAEEGPAGPSGDETSLDLSRFLDEDGNARSQEDIDVGDGMAVMEGILDDYASYQEFDRERAKELAGAFWDEAVAEYGNTPEAVEAALLWAVDATLEESTGPTPEQMDEFIAQVAVYALDNLPIEVLDERDLLDDTEPGFGERAWELAIELVEEAERQGQAQQQQAWAEQQEQQRQFVAGALQRAKEMIAEQLEELGQPARAVYTADEVEQVITCAAMWMRNPGFVRSHGGGQRAMEAAVRRATEAYLVPARGDEMALVDRHLGRLAGPPAVGR
jgi:hypothetical protein